MIQNQQIFPQFPDGSRIWIYVSNQAIDSKVKNEIQVQLQDFLSKWAAHGTALIADCAWVNDFQLVIALNEKSAGASGCSIDSKTRFLRQLGIDYSIDWYDRFSLIVQDNGEDKVILFQELDQFPNALLYDNLIQKLGELRTNWPIQISESRYRNLVN